MPTKIIDINEATIKSYVEHLRPEDLEIRKQVDIGYLYKANVVCLFEIRPKWDNLEEKEKIEFARIRYYKSKKIWKLYWMRSGVSTFDETIFMRLLILYLTYDKKV